jgi:hypothetical protein
MLRGEIAFHDDHFEFFAYHCDCKIVALPCFYFHTDTQSRRAAYLQLSQPSPPWYRVMMISADE